MSVLQDAVIATRKRNIYSACLKIRTGTQYGNRRDKLGATYEIEVKDHHNRPAYVIDEKHITEMYASSRPDWVRSLFDIRNVGKFRIYPNDQENSENLVESSEKSVEK